MTNAVSEELGECHGLVHRMGQRRQSRSSASAVGSPAQGPPVLSSLVIFVESTNDELLRVPLILRDPRQRFAVRRVKSQVRSIDILPTVLELLDVALPPQVEGRSLLPLMQSDERSHRPALSQLPQERPDTGRWALRDGRYKLILNSPRVEPRRPPFELFDLDRDPQERNNLAASEAELLDRLSSELYRAREPWKRDGPADYRNPGELPATLRERLKSLGYGD